MNLVSRFWRSQVGKKIVMAVTGLIGVGFVIGHMVGNLQVFEGAEKINAYGRFLHHTVGTELWLVRLVRRHPRVAAEDFAGLDFR